MPFEFAHRRVEMIWKANRTNEPSHRGLRGRIGAACEALPGIEG
ncbi:hypothetical protein [Oceaniradius stylonematis]|jgi:hypothetical protein|nr:hypothetical protein [Oceaniradius stylonematis]